MRVVFDTNVWVSSLLIPESSSGKLIKKWQASQFDVVISSYILEEIEKVLAYPKIQRRLNWSPNKIRNYLDLLAFFAEYIDVDKEIIHIKKDPKDSLILSTLIISHANFLISGDKDLLNLRNEYPILKISEFLEKLKK